MRATPKELFVPYKLGDGIGVCFNSIEQCDKEVKEMNDAFEKFYMIKHYPRVTNKRPYRRETLEHALELEKEYYYEKALKEQREEYGAGY